MQNANLLNQGNTNQTQKQIDPVALVTQLEVDFIERCSFLKNIFVSLIQENQMLRGNGQVMQGKFVEHDANLINKR